MGSDVTNTAADTSELIAFRVGEQEFCVNIMSVREIRGWTPAIPVPRSPPWVMGVINLRGQVLPIVDLARRLGMKPAVPSERHVIIVIQARSRVIGILVDAVSDILTISGDNIQPVPEISSDLERQYARGILAIDKRMVCLIEPVGLFPETESEAA